MKTPLLAKTFGNFDFSAVDLPNYTEDAVREDIIAPLLRAIGYSASGPAQMVRSKRLEHPYVMFGTTKRKLSIIPDYLLSVQGKTCFVLDAKAPAEKITSGDNVCQVYSYAIHPEIRSHSYGLCNGRQLALYEITSINPKIVYDLLKLTDLDILDINEKLNPRTILSTVSLGYIPDGGAYLHFVVDVPMSQVIHFTSVVFPVMGVIEDGKYNMNVTCNNMADRPLLFSFDFDDAVLCDLLKQLPENAASEIATSIKRHPYMYKNVNNPFRVNISCTQATEAAYSTKGEMFYPLQVTKFTYLSE